MNRSLFISLVVLFSVSAQAENDETIQKRIFDQYLQQAEKGDPNAQFLTASRYEAGKGTEKNAERAKHWYEMAANKGHPLAKVKVDELAAAVKVAAQRAEAAKTGEPAPPALPAKTPEARPVAIKAGAGNINPAQAVLGGKWSRASRPRRAVRRHDR